MRAPFTSLYFASLDSPIRSGCQHRCKQFADRYVEYEFIIIFLDIVLHRPQAYRHILFNRIPYRDSGLDVRFLTVCNALADRATAAPIPCGHRVGSL